MHAPGYVVVSSGNHISHVLLVGSEVEVRRIHASSVVAAVKDMPFSWVLSSVHQPSEAVCLYVQSSELEVPVIVRVS